MGLDNSSLTGLLFAIDNMNVNLESTLVIGRLKNYLGKKLRAKLILKKRISKKSSQEIYSDEILRDIFKSNFELLDISNYEGNIDYLIDLNEPIPDYLKNRFSLIFESGTIEHIFNPNAALHNLRQMCKQDGYIVLNSPANSWLGHGYYQFSPEFFFDNFQKNSGFCISKLILCKHGYLLKSKVRYYSVIEPNQINRRLSIRTYKRCELIVIAQKVADSKFKINAQQSDYQKIWNQKQEINWRGNLFLNSPTIIQKFIEFFIFPFMDKYKSPVKRLKFSWFNNKLVLKG